MDAFLREYLKDFNAARAAAAIGYSPISARHRGYELLHKPGVQEKLAHALVERAKRTELSGDEVLRQHHAVAMADPTELCELHRGACRYCWGKDNRYQFTPREMEEARAFNDYSDVNIKLTKAGLPLRPFDEAGGVGYNPRLAANPKCPECFGDGAERVVWKDTRDLSPEARRLYAGVEVTQHGMKVRMRDQDANLKALGQHHGLYKTKVEHSGPDGEPLGYVVVPAKRAADDVPKPAAAPDQPKVLVETKRQARKKFEISDG